AAMALCSLGLALEEKKYADLARQIVAIFARIAAVQPLNYLSLIAAAVQWRPVKPKEAPPPEQKPEIPEDEEEEARKEEPGEEEIEAQASRRAQRAARRERAAAAKPERERRSARAHRGARSRDR
ncbi:MAG: hypothetical protein IJU98_04135, partial [Synergistaceae bacterium]|nr:hypothetical protein [Synergistaceae bacterium]